MAQSSETFYCPLSFMPMTAEERDAMDAVPEGMLIWNRDARQVEQYVAYEGAMAWRQIAPTTMTTAERDAWTSPPPGSIIWNSDAQLFEVYQEGFHSSSQTPRWTSLSWHNHIATGLTYSDEKLTISSGSITVPGPGRYIVEREGGGVGSDYLDTIVGGETGDAIELIPSVGNDIFINEYAAGDDEVMTPTGRGVLLSTAYGYPAVRMIRTEWSGSPWVVVSGLSIVELLATKGDIPYALDGLVPVALAGNITTTKKFLTQTGTGSASAAPAWAVIVDGDVPATHAGSAHHTRSHAVTSTSDHTAGNWKIFYTNGSGEVVELLTGADGYILKGAGTSAAPAFEEDTKVIELITYDAGTASTTVPKVLVVIPYACTITAVKVRLNKAETCGATSVIFDVHKIVAADLDTETDGTTIYTTQANRPTITNTHMYQACTAPDVTSIAANDALALFVDQVGTSVTSATLMISVSKT